MTFHYNLEGLKEDEVWTQENAELRRRDPKILEIGVSLRSSTSPLPKC